MGYDELSAPSLDRLTCNWYSDNEPNTIVRWQNVALDQNFEYANWIKQQLQLVILMVLWGLDDEWRQQATKEDRQTRS